MPDITEWHPDYADAHETWLLIENSLLGEEAIKADTYRYLPFPVSIPFEIKQTEDFHQQYMIYLSGAQYVEYTAQAVEDLVSGVFSRDPIIDENMPNELKHLELTDLSKEITNVVTAYGRAFVLVDYPRTEGEVTVLQEIEEDINSYAVVYEPLDVINWTTVRQGGKIITTRVVLHEQDIVDGKYVDRYRELTIEDGPYTVRLYDEGGLLIEEFQPVASGSTLRSIPGVFVGTRTNDAVIDKSPVIGIARANIKHYQTTAELRHALTYVGHPMIAVEGAPLGFYETMKEQGQRLVVGASNALVLEGDSASAKILQIEPELPHFKELERLETSMAEMGYRIKTDKSGVESAEALRIRNSGNTSQLSSIATQVERAVVKVLRYASMFENVQMPEDFDFDLVKDYVQEPVNPVVVRELSGMINAGRLPPRVLYDYLTDVGLLDENENYDALVEESADFSSVPNMDELLAADRFET